MLSLEEMSEILTELRVGDDPKSNPWNKEGEENDRDKTADTNNHV